MSETPIPTDPHPHWFRRRVSTYWWLGRRSYLAFILRELSSLFIAWFVVFTLIQLRFLSLGTDNYRRFQAFAKNRVVLWANVVALFFIVFHSITWFKLAPQAMVVRLRGKRVPAAWISGSNYALWAVVSVLVAWIILREWAPYILNG
jgi:fumarate reductase subunit C